MSSLDACLMQFHYLKLLTLLFNHSTEDTTIEAVVNQLPDISKSGVSVLIKKVQYQENRSTSFDSKTSKIVADNSKTQYQKGRFSLLLYF